MLRAHSRFVRTGRAGGASLLVCAGAAVGLGGLARNAEAQLGGNIQTQIRPLVVVQFPAGANPTRVAVGILDTGNDNITIPPETVPFTNIGTQVAGNVWQNDSVVGTFTNLTASGFFGAALDGPEHTVNAGATPTHTFAAANRLNRTSAVGRGQFAPSLTYFIAGGGGAAFANSLVNLGSAYVSGVAGGEGAMVLGIDPTNATIMPFALRNRDPAVMNPAPPPAGLTPSSIPLDQRTSSVSFWDPAAGDPLVRSQIPTIMDNENPGFVSFYTLTASGGGGFVRTTAVDGMGRPTATTTGPITTSITVAAGDVLNNALGIAAGAHQVDTGGTGTGAAGGAIIGTATLNRFGQYFDFSNNVRNGGRATLSLWGPQRIWDQDLTGPGALIGVDRESVGLDRTGVNQLNRFGLPAQMQNNAAADGTGDVPQQHGAGIFRTHMSHSNSAYIAGRDALNLLGLNLDHIDEVSMGADRIDRRATLFFSVDRNSRGLPGRGTGTGGGVDGQRSLGQQAGDVFQSSTGVPRNNVPGTNELRFNQDVMGLSPNVGPLVAAVGRGVQDELTALDLRTQDAYGANAANSMRNLDPIIRDPNDTRNPDGAVSGVGQRGDRLGVTFDTYFSLDRASLSLGGHSAADVLVDNPAARGFNVFATAQQAGLLAGDDIDGISLMRPGSPLQGPLVIGDAPIPFNPTIIGGRYDPNELDLFATINPFQPPLLGGMPADLMLFSLTPDSPTLGLMDPFLGRPLSAADIFVTDFDGFFALFASAESLGLRPDDNIDALDSIAIPGPAAVLVLAGAGLLTAGRRPERRAREERKA